MANKYVIVLLVSVFISSVAQLVLKLSANKKYDSRLKEYLNPQVIFSYGIFFSATVLTVFAYKGVFLKSGPIIESSGYIFILFLGNIFLKEKITKNKIIGVLLIIAGIAIFSV